MRSPVAPPDTGPCAGVAGEPFDADADALPPDLREVMAFARTELGMDTAFVAEASGDRRIIRVLDDDGDSFGLEVDGQCDLPDALRRAVLDGPIPTVPDMPASGDTGAPSRDAARGWDSVPIVRADGTLYGTLCWKGQPSDKDRTRRDLGVMRLLARLIGAHLPSDAAQSGPDAVRRIRHAIEDPEVVRTVLQPIVGLSTGEIAGFEALTRFATEPVRGPDAWFAEAAHAGLGVDLEIVTLRAALSWLERIPEGMFLSVNVSPACIADRRLIDEVERAGNGLLLLELTEQDRVECYDVLIDELAELRTAGVGLAIDDVGSGFSSMTHVLQLEPDLVKLDAALTRGIELDPRRSTLISAMTRFADAARAELVAEGVETSREMEALRDIGVPLGQGFYLARPEAPARHLERAAAARRRGFVRRP